MANIDINELKEFVKDYTKNPKLDINFNIDNDRLVVELEIDNKVSRYSKELSSDDIKDIEANLLAIVLQSI